ncbi:MAG: pyruvate dehydrogenase complex dihydrolipoyllysine-residue acetyltransferase, partial [Actinobacteria bacterium]|nr:pyruvate dehydrogenase complex dihydrolipoyllysine-residue acetyltransferase [Actinomycetota bacterium]
MPQLGETVTEGTILRWAKQVGDTISEDEVLVEISTDKVDTEVPSPVSGKILEILVEEGETVEVGHDLVRIGEEGEEAEEPEPEAEEPEAEAEEEPKEDEAEKEPEPEEEPEEEPEAKPEAKKAPEPEEEPEEEEPSEERVDQFFADPHPDS